MRYRSWAKKEIPITKFKMNLAVFAQARRWARVAAQQNLMDHPIAPAAYTDCKVQVILVTFTDLENILAELKKGIKNNTINSIAVGVAWGRKAGFPGGAYSVSLLLFE